MVKLMWMIEQAKDNNFQNQHQERLAPLQESDIQMINWNGKVWAFMEQAEKEQIMSEERF